MSKASVGGLPPLAIRAWLRYVVVERVFQRIAPRTVLEVGCGQGAIGARLAQHSEYVAVEPDDSSYAVAASRIEPSGGTVIHGVHADVAAGSTFDVVCAFEVLEHLEHDDQALEEWVASIRPGGHLVMSVPAFQSRFGPMDENAGPFRRYEPDELRAQLERAGLTDVETTVYGWPLGYALEAVRNRIDARKLARRDATMEDLTFASGRTFQPPNRIVGLAVAVLVRPFCLLQRLRPDRGIGLVVSARKPA
ncbi:MAG: class I SAM-dependent methyltransferase [Aeromicrobium sp.]